MGNNRPIDKTKKTNIKCEHCKHWNKDRLAYCVVDNRYTNYWNRCKKFEWRTDKEYKAENEGKE